MLFKLFNYLKSLKNKIFKKRPLPSQLRPQGAVRKKQRPKYKSFRLHKPIKPDKYKKLPSSWRLFKDSFKTIFRNWRNVFIFLFIYGVIYYLFVRATSSTLGIADMKETFKLILEDSFGVVLTSVAIFSVMISNANIANSEISTIYQFLILVIFSLAFIRMLRVIHSSSPPKKLVKESFYNGMSQFVQFFLVLLIISIEFIPFILASTIANIVLSSEFIIGPLAISLLCLAAALALLSLYLISGSVSALYIVTLPGIDPIKAVLSSHELLALHRWSVVRKFVFLLIYLVIFNALIFIPLIIFVPVNYMIAIEVLYYLSFIFSFAVTHTYLYTLYKNLL